MALLGSPVTDARSRDAVIVIPGIMGSELVDAASGRVLWGLADPRWYVSAWTGGHALDALAVTEAERAGDLGRVRATRLLRVPVFAPVLRGVEPYTDLLAGLRRAVAHPDAVVEFAYDWRLSVAYNAGRLADLAQAQLARWRAHPQGSRDARLVLVAHSMGGLIARYFTGVLGDGGAVRATVTLGTPFYGSVKVAHILSTGRGAPLPLPRRRLRALALTLPGLYDLLPAYRCVDDADTARRLTPGDVAGIGGDPELAEQAQARQSRLATVDGGGLWPLIGVEQPTMQSLTLADGVADTHLYTLLPGRDGGVRREDRGGDSTVYRDAAAPPGPAPQHLPQKHAALARSPEALAHARAVISREPLGPWLGRTALGIDVPDVVAVGAPFEVSVSTVDDPAVASCRVVEAGTGLQVARPVFARRDGGLAAALVLARPGVYRVEVKGGGFSAVTDLVLAVPGDELTGHGAS